MIGTKCLHYLECCSIVKYCSKGVKYWRARLHERRNRLTPANLKKIPTKKFKEGNY